MNIVIPYKSLENLFNWNIMYILNYSNEYFKINYSDSNCVLENVYVKIPHNPDELQEFHVLFEEFKTSIFNRCRMTLPKKEKDYVFQTTSNSSDPSLDESSSTLPLPSMIRINNIKINDNVICLNYDNIN